MAESDNSGPNRRKNVSRKKANFRPLRENEIKLLFALWQLTYVDNQALVTAEAICDKAGLTKNQFHSVLSDLWHISRDCYIQSTPRAVGNLAVYRLVDEQLISTSSTGRIVLNLYARSHQLRISLNDIRDEIIKAFGSDEKFDARLEWLVVCGYLQEEEQGTYHFCHRFISEIDWIKKLVEYDED